jgi:hypothetical protein
VALVAQGAVVSILLHSVYIHKFSLQGTLLKLKTGMMAV